MNESLGAMNLRMARRCLVYMLQKLRGSGVTLGDEEELRLLGGETDDELGYSFVMRCGNRMLDIIERNDWQYDVWSDGGRWQKKCMELLLSVHPGAFLRWDVDRIIRNEDIRDRALSCAAIP